MYYPFSLEKAAAASGVLLADAQHGCMEYMRLLKLLYISDREALRETDCPILGARVVAMKYGPLHSRLYDIIKGEDVLSDEWQQLFIVHGVNIHMVAPQPINPLSKFEIRKLKEVSARYANVDTFDLVKRTHEFDEWKTNYPDPDAYTSQAIEFEDILQAIGRLDDRDRLESAMKDSYHLHNLLRDD